MTQPPYGQPPYGQPPYGQPAPAQGQPAPAQGQPASAQGQPAPAQGQYAPAQGHPAPAQGQYTSPQGQYTPSQGHYAAPPQAMVPPPPEDGRWQPARIDPVAGTGYGLVQLQVNPAMSGAAVGSLIAGIAAVLVSVLVLCFGVAGSTQSWGGWVAGAFTLLSALVGGGAVALGFFARRQIRHSGRDGRMRFTGAGTAMAGICCGAAGAGIALLALVLTLVLQLS